MTNGASESARDERPRRVLLTGGAGFIGSHVAERLASDHELVLFDDFRRNSLSQTEGLVDRDNVRVVRGDVLDPESLSEAMKGVDTVVHLAAIAGVSSYYTEPVRTLEVNLLGTVNVLKEAARQKVEKFVYFSTSEVFGSDAMFVDETVPCGIGPSSEPRWTYATSKLAGEQFTLRTAEQAGFRAVIVRPFNIYGPRQTGEGAISNFVSAALAKEPLVIHGDGTEVRAWCYVDDLVDALATMLEIELERNESFNIGNPHEIETTLGLARRVAAQIGEVPVKFEDVSRAPVRARVPDIRRAHRLLGFQPQVSLETGLSRTIDWYRRKEGSA